jgi:hypothetical protein
MANIGLGQVVGPAGEREAPLLTAGNDLGALGLYLTAAGRDYGAEDVLRILQTA